MSPPLVDVDELAIDYRTGDRRVRALDGASLRVEYGEAVGLIGESGSGKSTVGMAIARLLPTTAKRVTGDVRVDGHSVFDYGPTALRAFRRDTLGVVFQNPLASLDPTRRVRDQVGDVVGSTRLATIARLLERVKLADPERVAASYPHQLSGGMAQRVAIALAIARGPKLIIADEPTAALDASIRAQILDLLIGLCRDLDASLLLLSHDLRAVASYCHVAATMYGGRVVEVGPTTGVFLRPAHPYTAALLQAAPGIEGVGDWLRPIKGAQAVLTDRQECCPFSPRCGWAVDTCVVARPEPKPIDGRRVVCHRAHEMLRAGVLAPSVGVGAEQAGVRTEVANRSSWEE